MKNSLILTLLFLSLLYSCASESSSSSDSQLMDNGSTGKAGSTARFAVVGDYMYAVHEQNLQLFNITNPAVPVKGKTVTIFAELETIFPYGNSIFIGTRTGMYIYDISNPENPVNLSVYRHVYACDPVVVSDKYAYVTLRAARVGCGHTENSLTVIDISNLRNPNEVNKLNMDGPKGLGVDGKTVYVCDANNIRVFDATNVSSIKEIVKLDITANDVIPLPSLLIITADDGIYQYRFEKNIPTLLSKITINKPVL